MDRAVLTHLAMWSSPYHGRVHRKCQSPHLAAAMPSPGPPSSPGSMLVVGRATKPSSRPASSKTIDPLNNAAAKQYSSFTENGCFPDVCVVRPAESSAKGSSCLSMARQLRGTLSQEARCASRLQSAMDHASRVQELEVLRHTPVVELQLAPVSTDYDDLDGTTAAADTASSDVAADAPPSLVQHRTSRPGSSMGRPMSVNPIEFHQSMWRKRHASDTAALKPLDDAPSRPLTAAASQERLRRVRGPTACRIARRPQVDSPTTGEPPSHAEAAGAVVVAAARRPTSASCSAFDGHDFMSYAARTSSQPMAVTINEIIRAAVIEHPAAPPHPQVFAVGSDGATRPLTKFTR